MLIFLKNWVKCFLLLSPHVKNWIVNAIGIYDIWKTQIIDWCAEVKWNGWHSLLSVRVHQFQTFTLCVTTKTNWCGSFVWCIELFSTSKLYLYELNCWHFGNYLFTKNQKKTAFYLSFLYVPKHWNFGNVNVNKVFWFCIENRSRTFFKYLSKYFSSSITRAQVVIDCQFGSSSFS